MRIATNVNVPAHYLSKRFPHFEIVTELQRPVAIIIQDIEPFAQADLRFIYSLLPLGALAAPELAERWQCELVACHPDWAKEQLRRVPMTRPRDNLVKITIE